MKRIVSLLLCLALLLGSFPAPAAAEDGTEAGMPAIETPITPLDDFLTDAEETEPEDVEDLPEESQEPEVPAETVEEAPEEETTEEETVEEETGEEETGEAETVEEETTQELPVLSEAAEALAVRIAALPTVDEFVSGCQEDSTAAYRSAVLGEVRSIRQALEELDADELELMELSPLTALEERSAQDVQAVQDFIDAILRQYGFAHEEADMARAFAAPSGSLEDDLAELYAQLDGLTEEEIAQLLGLDRIAPLADGLETQVTGTPEFAANEVVYFQFDNAPSRAANFEQTLYANKVYVSGTENLDRFNLSGNTDGTITASYTATVQAVYPNAESTDDLSTDDLSDFEFTFTQVDGKGSTFQISQNEKYLSLSNANMKRDGVFSSSPVGITLHADTYTDSGCFRLSSGSGHLYFYKTTPGGYTNPFFACAESYTASGNGTRCSVVLLKKEDNGSSAIPGYSLVTGTSQLHGASCLIASITPSGVYLLDAADEHNAVKLRTEVKASCTADTNGAQVAVLKNGSHTLTVNTLTVGFPIAQATPHARTETIRLAPKEQQIFADHSGIYSSSDLTWQEGGEATVQIEVTSTNSPASIPVLNYGSGVYNVDSGQKLTDCLYQFITYNDGQNGQRFLLTAPADGTRVFLNINGQGNNGQGYPNSIYPDPISFAANADGSFHIYDIYDKQDNRTCDLAYSTWGFFTRSVGGSVSTRHKLYIFRYVDGNFYQVFSTEDLVNGGQYIITATQDDTDFYVLKPHLFVRDDGTRNAHTALISNSVQIDGEQKTVNFAAASTVTFTGAAEGTAQVTIGPTTYYITVAHTPVYTATEKALPNMSYSTLLNETRRVADIPAYFTEGDLQWDNFRDDIVRGFTLEARQQPESYAWHHSGGSNGHANGYRANEFPLSEALYTAKADGANWRLTAGTIPLSVRNGGFPGSGAGEPLQIQAVSGGFTIFGTESNYYLAFRRNGWGVFFSKEVAAATGTGLTEQDCVFHLFRKDETVTDGALPGYRQVHDVSELESGGQYLIAAFYEESYFLLYPSTSAASRNPHVCVATKEFTSGYTTISFVGHSVGRTAADVKKGMGTLVLQTTAKLDGNYTPGAFLSQVGKGMDHVLEKLTISVGSSYKLAVNPQWNIIPTVWLSSDEDYVTIHDGVLYAKATDASRGFVSVKVGCLDAQGSQYVMEVVVIDTGVGSYRWDLFTVDVNHTDVYYAWCQDNMYYTTNDLRKIGANEHLYLSMPSSRSAINFFAKAQDGYALVYMDAPGSSGQYRSLLNSDGTTEGLHPKNTAFYTSGSPVNQTSYTIRSDAPTTPYKYENAVQSMIGCAMFDLKCTGAMGFSSPVSMALTFSSDRLPSLEKKVLAVTQNGENKPYVDGMKVQRGDTVQFMVTVKTYASAYQKTLTYTSAIMRDNLDDITVSGYSINHSGTEIITELDSSSPLVETVDGNPVFNLTELLNTYGTGTSASSIKIFLSYVVQEDAIGSSNTLTNTADLEFQYKSAYDAGSLSSDAHAKAILTVGLRDLLGYINLSVSGDIGLNVYLKNDEPVENPNTRSFAHLSQHYLVIAPENGSAPTRYRLNSTSGDETPAGVQAQIQGADGTMLDCTRFSVKVPPQDITTPIRLYVESSEGDRITEMVTLSVEDYAKLLLTEEGKTKLITSWSVDGQSFSYSVEQAERLQALIQAMLNYGAFTQTYLQYRTDALPQCSITSQELNSSVSRILDNLSPDQQNSLRPTVADDPGTGITLEGMALQLDPGCISMRIYFSHDAARFDIADLKAKYNFIQQEYSGNAYMYTYSALIQRGEDSKDAAVGYYILVPNISSQWLNNTFRVTVTNTKWNLFTSVELSPLTYLFLLRQSDSGDSALRNMVYAMYLYNQAATDYFGASANA